MTERCPHCGDVGTHGNFVDGLFIYCCLTHVADDARREWNRGRRHELRPHHRFYFDDATESWCDREGTLVPYQEVHAWVQGQCTVR